MSVLAIMLFVDKAAIHVQASSTYDKLKQEEKERKAKENQADKAQDKIDNLENQQSGLQTELANLNQKLTDISQRLEDLESMIEQKEAEADAFSEVSGVQESENDPFAQMDKEKSINEELEKLKQEMNNNN